jgi:P-type E1-E2 ATPase
VADKKVNEAMYKVLQPDGTKKVVPSKDLRVGDILMIEANQFFPADLVLLTSALEDGICYIETSQLDGYEASSQTYIT